MTAVVAGVKSETLGPAGKSEQRTEEEKEQRRRTEEVREKIHS